MGRLERSALKLGYEKITKKSLLFRIYEWPLSYFVGLSIGTAVVLGFTALESSLNTYLEPTGIFLFLGGWVILIGSGFGTGMDKFIDLPPRTNIQKWVLRISIVLGIALNMVAWIFFTTPIEIWEDRAGTTIHFPLQIGT